METAAVIVPAANEAGNIGRVVEEIRKACLLATIVVDNGSTDSTAREASQAGARVVSEPRRGYGYACSAGVAAAGDVDILVFLDGDLSFSPAELPTILAPIFEDRAELVLGSRELGHTEPGSMYPQQRFGNWLGSRMMSLLYGISITDLGPYRAIRGELLRQLNMREMSYGWPTEMIVKAASRRARILEVPVSYRSRLSGRSKVSGTVRGSLLAGWHIISVTLRYAFTRFD